MRSPHRLARSDSRTTRLHGAAPPSFATIGKGLLGLKDDGDLPFMAAPSSATVAGLARPAHQGAHVGAVNGPSDAGSGSSGDAGYTSNDFAPSSPVWQAIYAASAGACAYHGYKRDKGSIGWTLGWALFGGTLPVLAVPIALAQGFGKPA